MVSSSCSHFGLVFHFHAWQKMWFLVLQMGSFIVLCRIENDFAQNVSHKVPELTAKLILISNMTLEIHEECTTDYSVLLTSAKPARLLSTVFLLPSLLPPKQHTILKSQLLFSCPSFQCLCKMFVFLVKNIRVMRDTGEKHVCHCCHGVV